MSTPQAEPKLASSVKEWLERAPEPQRVSLLRLFIKSIEHTERIERENGQQEGIEKGVGASDATGSKENPHDDCENPSDQL